MDIAVVLGENISFRRRQLGLSQKELALRLGITQDAMSRIEKGNNTPKLSRLVTISENLQCSVSYLFHSQEDAVQEVSATMAEILQTLPKAGREALLHLVVDAAKIMRGAQ